MVHLGIEFPGPGYSIDGKALLDAQGKLGVGSSHVFITRTPLWESLLKTRDGFYDKLRELDEREQFKDYAIRTVDAKLIHRKSRAIEEKYSIWTYVSGKKVSRPEYEFYDTAKDPGERTIIQSDPRIEALKKELSAFESRPIKN